MLLPTQRRSATGASADVVVVHGDAASVSLAVSELARAGWLTTAACEVGTQTWELRVVPRD